MARHWFYTFGTNPSVESFARSLSGTALGVPFNNGEIPT
jgi:hypothetical protein